MIRAYRHDIGREVEIPKDSLRWGPDLGQGTCAAGLLRDAGEMHRNAGRYGSGFVPYFLPFSGAKFGIRVTIPPLGPHYRQRRAASAFLSRFPEGRFREVERGPDGRVFVRGFVGPDYSSAVLSGLEAEWVWSGSGEQSPADRASSIAPAPSGEERLRSLIDAAADALRAEDGEPDALGTALEHLAACVDWIASAEGPRLRPKWIILGEIRDFLREQVDGQIRRAAAAPASAPCGGLTGSDIKTLRSAVAWLRSSPIGSNPDVALCADDLCALTDRLVAGRG